MEPDAMLMIAKKAGLEKDNACYGGTVGGPVDILSSINATRFAKRVLYTHSFKTHFSLPFDSYINGPIAHLFNNAEG